MKGRGCESLRRMAYSACFFSHQDVLFQYYFAGDRISDLVKPHFSDYEPYIRRERINGNFDPESKAKRSAILDPTI